MLQEVLPRGSSLRLLRFLPSWQLCLSSDWVDALRSSWPFRKSPCGPIRLAGLHPVKHESMRHRKTASHPENVKLLWQFSAGTTLIFYLFFFIFLKNLGCAWHSQDWPEELWFAFTFANKQHLMWFRKDQTFWRKFENKAHRLWGINTMKNIKAKKEKIFHRNESKEGGVVAQDTPTPAKAVISKLITLVLILYLWFMELTAGLTHAFHYAWLLGMKGFCCCVFKKFLHLLSKLEFGLYKRWTLCLIEWESLFWGSKCVSFYLFLDVFHDWLCCCICSNTLTVGFLPIWIVICFITTHVLVKII